MANKNQAPIPIRESDIELYKESAETLLKEVSWTPKKGPGTPKQVQSTGLMLSAAITSDVAEKVSLIRIASEFCDNAIVFSDEVHYVLHIVKRGLQIGSHLEALYAKASGVEDLELQNKGGKLNPSQQAEFGAKQSTRSAVALYGLASYVVWELAGFRAEETSGVSMEEPSIPECPLTSSLLAKKAIVFYLGQGLRSEQAVNTDIAFVKYALMYFRSLIKELKLREEQLQYKESFTDRKYKLENSEFIVDGFEEQGDRSVVSVEFNRVLFTDIVGNHIAKHHSMRTIARMLCYDLETKRNPMLDFGGMASIRLGHGFPGTGKSMLIAAIATELDARAKWLGIPFLFHPLPDSIVSTYQGGSAERMMAWMNVLRDPTKLIYAPIDDAENSFENRTRQGVSSGVREVIAVFLRNTEGAYAVNRGNTLIDVMTNLPEQIDAAVMSRIVERFKIDGAVMVNDFTDQDYAWWKKYAAMSSDFVDMKDPKNYKYFDDQKPMKSVSESHDRYTEAKHPDIKRIIELVTKGHDPSSHEFFSVVYTEVKKVFPGFTSRDVRNVQSAVTSRILDFDMPTEWLDDPQHFFAKSYDEKKNLLMDLMKANMKGVSFAALRFEEMLRYLDTMADMANIDFDRKVAQTIESMRVHGVLE
jgi:hypothetical protein